MCFLFVFCFCFSWEARLTSFGPSQHCQERSLGVTQKLRVECHGKLHSKKFPLCIWRAPYLHDGFPLDLPLRSGSEIMYGRWSGHYHISLWDSRVEPQVQSEMFCNLMLNNHLHLMKPKKKFKIIMHTLGVWVPMLGGSLFFFLRTTSFKVIDLFKF
jgi:hypothetical protein